MALKLALKANERVIIGGAVVTNGPKGTTLFIENSVPVLRQKDILSEKEADSPARRIYLVVQLMYIDEKNLTTYHKNYWDLVREFIAAAPSTLGLIDQISEHILHGRYYQALKLVKKLIAYEQEAIERAKESITSISNR
jgi:flagellar protein FlbT